MGPRQWNKLLSNIVLADAMKVYGEVDLYSSHTFIVINL